MEHIRPESLWIITFSGLLYPVVMAMNIICIVYWLCRKKIRSVFLIMCVIALAVTVDEIFSFSWNKKPSEKAIKIITYNIGGFSLGKEKKSAPQTADWLKEQNPDIFCMQEFEFPENDAGYFKSIPYHAKSANGGTTIFSKFPILNSGEYSFEKTLNNIFWADIKVHGKLVKIINVHLQTTSVTSEEVKVRQDFKSLNGIQMYGGIRRAIKHLMENYRLRAKQMDQLKKIINESKLPFIICGDFNETPYSYAYKTVTKHLSDGFKKCGNGYGYTYHRFMHVLRIDYILYTDDWEGYFYESPELPYSDHNPVIMTIGLKE